MKLYLIWQLFLSLTTCLWPGLPTQTHVATTYQGTNNITDSTRDFPVQPFDRIKITETLVVTVKAGNTFSVKATGRPEDINTLLVNVKKGLLDVTYQPVRSKKNQDVVINRDEVKLTITLPVLKQAEFQKSSQFTVEGFAKLKTLELVLNSLASGSANVSTENLKLTLDSQSKLTLQGETTVLDASLQGQSTLTAFDLKTKEASLQAGGMSKVSVSVTDKLQASASGSSEVVYKGKPEVKTSQGDSSFVREYAK